MTHLRLSRFFPILFALVFALGLVIPAHAAEVNVACDTADLIAAITTANANAEADTLNLAADCVYAFTIGDATNNDSALPRITTEIIINGNGATLQRDAGAGTNFRLLRVINTGNLTLNNVTVTGGAFGFGEGGGIYSAGTLTVTNSIVTGNSAGFGFGGGIHITSGTLVVTNSTFSSNSADFGGGILIDLGTATVTNSTFLGNSSSYGGGIYNANDTLTVINSTVTGNSASNDGGGILNFGTLMVTNSTISGNSASVTGGGIYNGNISALTVTGSTLSGNSATFGGGGIFNEGMLTVTNSILWGNNSAISGTATVTFSIVEGGFSGTGNMDIDPLFVAPVAFGSAPTTTGDYHLQTISPAVNVGSNAALPADALDLDGDLDTSEAIPYDLDGNTRVVGGAVDMGAYELQPVELLVNGGFEDAGINNGTPASWVIGNGSTDKRKCLNGKALTGDCAFKFTGSLTDASILSQNIDLVGLALSIGDTLDFSAFFKGNNPTAKVKIVLKASYSDGPATKAKLTVTQNAAYTQHVAPTLTLASANVSKIKLKLLHLSNAGAIYVDDASLIFTVQEVTERGAVRAAGAEALPLPVAPGGFRGNN